MATFLCAVHARGTQPRAFALVEQLPGPGGPTYAVRDLRALDGEDPTGELLRVTASEKQYAGAVRFVTTGGPAAADALRARGPSAMAVQFRGEAAGGGAETVALQVLVDTFERLFREGCVSVPGTLDAASAAVDALYSAADLEAAAPDGDRDGEADLDDDGPADGPAPDVVRQSGGQAALSTAATATRDPDEASALAAETDAPLARVAAATGADEPDLGAHADVATALALAVWFGETARDRLGPTDQADEALTARLAEKPVRA